MACNFGKENFTRVNAALPSVLILIMSICYFIYFPFWFRGHDFDYAGCRSFYFLIRCHEVIHGGFIADC